jgi:outer membrane protein OmpA-like peptidoglycan-associated protein
MKTRQNMFFFTAGTTLILLTGCVSSRKYKASQADVAKLKSDSTQQAQQIASLNGNVQDLQNRTTAMQRSLDSSSTSYAAQQKNLDYYQSYFKGQQGMMSQVSDDLKGALTQAGINNADVEQVNNTVIVRLDENELFRKNSTSVSTGGKKALDNLSQVIANKSNVHVFVANGDSSIASAAGTMPMEDNTPKPVHHRVHHMAAASTSGTAAASTSGTAAASTNSSSMASNNGTPPAPKKVHHHYSSEGSMAIHNGPGHANHAWALKQARMVTIANHFLKNGAQKINVSLEKPAMDGSQPSNTIKVVFLPKMEDFNPQANSSAVR